MTVFTVFFANPEGNPAKYEEFLPYMKVGRLALSLTNPGAEYVVLTDRATAPLLEKHVQVAATAPDTGPLMVKYQIAQRNYLKSAKNKDFYVLAGTDCIAMRVLSRAIMHDVGFATTFNKSGRINNVAYIRDVDQAIWFLDKAIAVLDSWEPERQRWFGDQESWEDVLGGPVDPKVAFHVRTIEGRKFHLFNCVTHNRFPRQCGRPKRLDSEAFILHFKGERKQVMIDYVVKNIVGKYSGQQHQR